MGGGTARQPPRSGNAATSSRTPYNCLRGRNETAGRKRQSTAASMRKPRRNDTRAGANWALEVTPSRGMLFHPRSVPRSPPSRPTNHPPPPSCLPSRPPPAALFPRQPLSASCSSFFFCSSASFSSLHTSRIDAVDAVEGSWRSVNLVGGTRKRANGNGEH